MPGIQHIKAQYFLRVSFRFSMETIKTCIQNSSSSTFFFNYYKSHFWNIETSILFLKKRQNIFSVQASRHTVIKCLFFFFFPQCDEFEPWFLPCWAWSLANVTCFRFVNTLHNAKSFVFLSAREEVNIFICSCSILFLSAQLVSGAADWVSLLYPE